LLSNAVNYSINTDIINFNITSFEDIQELQLKYEDILLSSLKKANKSFNNNKLDIRGCNFLAVICCASLYSTMFATCGASLAACIGTIVSTGSACSSCLMEM